MTTPGRGNGDTPANVLELRGVWKTYGRGPAAVHALRGVSLSVAAAEMVAVIGPSGSGKSTLLTIAGSLEDPTSGQVRIGGAKLEGNDQTAPLRVPIEASHRAIDRK